MFRHFEQILSVKNIDVDYNNPTELEVRELFKAAEDVLLLFNHMQGRKHKGTPLQWSISTAAKNSVRLRSLTAEQQLQRIEAWVNRSTEPTMTDDAAVTAASTSNHNNSNTDSCLNMTVFTPESFQNHKNKNNNLQNNNTRCQKRPRGANSSDARKRRK